MDEREGRSAFERHAGAGLSAEAVRSAAAQVRAGGDQAPEAGRALAAGFAHVAFAAPERSAEIYDAATLGWTGAPAGGPEIAPVAGAGTPEALDGAFWSDFWSLVDDVGGGMDAGTVTMRTAALGARLSGAFPERLAKACAAYPRVAEAAANGPPGRFSLEDLAACPEGSLGHEFHELIVRNGFDLEVLDRDALGLQNLPLVLHYLNARILQVHDLWHLVGGYETTGLHEVAISGFQLGQFGHGYSAMFLAMVATATAVRENPAAPILLETILSAYAHGRRTPPLIDLRWEEVWSLPKTEVRRHAGVSPYPSPFPANLFEQAAAA